MVEGLLTQLNFYGPVIIRRYSTFWHCYCDVRLFEHSEIKEIAQTTGVGLYTTLRELLKQSALTKKKLIDKARAPKQGSFNYGSENKDWQEFP